jgi:putative ubiquitin-RnfH superfamily antitoxin RatB of RatAB toxin-antitoxin module
MDSEVLRVEVAYALPDQQRIFAIDVPRGATVNEAILASGICGLFPEIDLRGAAVGVFGKRVTMETPLHAGDRVEIYRPLIADPKQARRQRAARRARR